MDSLVTHSWKPSASTLPGREVTLPNQLREQHHSATKTSKAKDHRLQGKWRVLRDWPSEVEATDLVMGCMATKEGRQLEGHSL